MGIQLITQALQPDWAHLNSYDRLILIRMCLTALDRGPTAGQYYAGHAVLAIATSGKDTGHDGAEQTRVRRAIRRLTKAGAITCTRPGNSVGKWATATYQIHLTGPVDNYPQGDTE